jgi:hypothetical protein
LVSGFSEKKVSIKILIQPSADITSKLPLFLPSVNQSLYREMSGNWSPPEQRE